MFHPWVDKPIDAIRYFSRPAHMTGKAIEIEANEVELSMRQTGLRFMYQVPANEVEMSG